MNSCVITLTSTVFPHSSVGKKKIHLQCKRPCFDSWVGKIPWKRDRLLTPVFLCFPCGSAGKESTCNAGNLGLIPGLGRPLGKGKWYPLQYACLENSMGCIVHGVTCIVHGVAKSRTRLSDFHFIPYHTHTHIHTNTYHSSL